MKKQVKARIARLKKQSILVILIGIIVTSISTVSANQTRSGRALLSSGNLSKQQVDLLVLQLAGKPHKDFRDFCLSIYNSSRIMLTGQQKNAIARFALKQELSGPQREIIFRILGIYSQLKYGGEAIRSLGDLVEIPTVSSRRGSRAQFSKAGKVLKEKSQKFGLKFQSLKHGGYLMSFPWRKPEGASVAIYTRLGVHEADEQKWRLNDGRRVDPYKMTKDGSKFYGRGTQSNKNAIVAAMYAMRVIVEENIRLFNAQYKLKARAEREELKARVAILTNRIVELTAQKADGLFGSAGGNFEVSYEFAANHVDAILSNDDYEVAHLELSKAWSQHMHKFVN